MSKQRRLGRGLEALLGRAGDGDTETVDSWNEPESVPIRREDVHSADTTGLTWIGVYEIDRNPFQPRKHFDDGEIQQLAESIAEHGMLQPIVVRKAGNRCQIIAGERRWRAATVAGWEKVPTQVLEADDRQMAELAIVENVQRKDLNALEKAASFQRYIEQYQCRQEELATRLKLDRSTIANLIRLLELPEPVQEALRTGEISAGHARALLPLGDEREQIDFARRIVAESLSVRATEDLVKSMIEEADQEPLSVVGGEAAGSSGAAKPARKPSRSQHVAILEQELRSAVGAKVDIRQTAQGRGRIVLHFKSHEEFERLRAYLASPTPAAKSQAG